MKIRKSKSIAATTACGRVACALLTLLLTLAPPAASAQARWNTIGPAGGDARVIAGVPGKPEHLYLGTTDSWVYESTDGGGSWNRLARLDASDDLVIDHILVDPEDTKLVYAAGWRLSRNGGGIWLSRDAGRTWAELAGMRGQSIRSFVAAPADHHMLFAGTLEGVFRSPDGGANWELISPAGSREIHEVESLAVDPVNSQVVYAGTWHLPWKTTDGGKSWHNIKQGVIDDSDVFSIIIDPAKPRVVYASACSGIYKSENGGELFHKIQGIPATARRTRVLHQDPVHKETVYAGTTEGLYKTTDGGHTFRRITDDDVIVNDVYVDPTQPDRILLATDRGGVLLSQDAGKTFSASNEGFSGRKVEALLVDRAHSLTLYAGVLNDKVYGGAFISEDGGAKWRQLADGLEGRDVFTLAQADDGTLLAGTNGGIFALRQGQSAWEPANTIANTLTKIATESLHGKSINVEKRVKQPLGAIDGRVLAFDLSGDAWLASTQGGVYTSRDKGATWQGGPLLGQAGYLSVAAHGKEMAAARPEGVAVSKDGGLSWWPIGIPTALTRIHRILFTPDGTLWIGAREGVYFTRDGGKSWMWVHRLPLADVDDLYYDAGLDRILASSRGSDFVYAIDPKSLDWKWWQTGYRLNAVRVAKGRIVAASLYDGVLVEPPQAEEVGKR